MTKSLSRIVHLVPMFGILGTIFFLSHQPGNSLYMPPILWIDKIAHMAIYAMLAAAVLYAFYSRRKGERTMLPYLLTMGICILYGIGDEFHQSFIPDRSVSFADVVADTIGAAAACAVWFLWRRRGGEEVTYTP